MGTRAGDYELLLPLGHGGMATVHLARRRGAAGFERLVVIKRVHAHLAADPMFRAMLSDEARLCSRIHHPNVVPAIDVLAEGDALALVLDYVEAISLAELARAALAAGGPLPAPIAARIMGDALAGLHAAHEATDLDGTPLGIVHRDVSPENILVGADGVARLIDFGVAKAIERVHVTEAGVLKGKLRYMSPEQARHKEVDRRSDVFSAGAVLYEALCGAPVFDAATEASMLLEILVGEVPEARRPDGSPLAPEVQRVLARALDGDVRARFATADEFRRALLSAIVPAEACDVAAAVRMHASARLDARRAEIAARVEARAPSPDAAHSAAHFAAHSGADSTGGPASAPARAWRRPLLLAAGVALAVAATAFAAHFARRAPPDAARALAAEAPIADAPASTPAPAAPALGAPAARDAGHAAPPSEDPPAPRRRPSPTRAPSRASGPLHGNPYP